MRVLLDTCVLAELRHPKGSRAVKRSVAAISDDDLFISVISIGEIVKGVSLLDEGKRKRALHQWMQGLESMFSERIITIDTATSHIWGEVTAQAQKSGKAVSSCDGLIAASAIRHGLYVMTRNSDDFEPTGVMLINPWL